MVHISISILGFINQQISLGGHHLVHGGAGLATWTYWGQSGDVLEIANSCLPLAYHRARGSPAKSTVHLGLTLLINSKFQSIMTIA